MKVVILSEVDWDYLWQRHHVWATLYAEQGLPTFYINKQGMRMPKWHEWGYVLKRILQKPNVPTSSPVKIRSPLFFPGNSLVSRLLNRFFFVPRFVKELRNEADLLLHVYQPTALTQMLIEELPGAQVLYDCVQNFADHPTASTATRRIEKWLIARADLMITDSDFLYELHKPVKKDLIQVPPGVDFDAFRSCYRGDEKSSHPRFVYYGNIRSDLDFTLINGIAERGYSVTLVGKTHPDILLRISPRVKLVPQKTYAELPAFLKMYDILLLPYAVNSFTQGIIPAKMYECLAMGKPILATRFGNLKKFETMLHFIDHAEEIEGVLEQIRQEPDLRVKERIACAQNESWQARFHLFYGPINKPVPFLV